MSVHLSDYLKGGLKNMLNFIRCNNDGGDDDDDMTYDDLNDIVESVM